MSNCRFCPNLMIITEHGKFERRCIERLETTYEDHDCHKYISLENISENKMSEERKLIKVIMEYDNGDKEYIEGDDVEKWQKALNGAILLDFTHGKHAQDILKDIIWRRV